MFQNNNIFSDQTSKTSQEKEVGSYFFLSEKKFRFSGEKSFKRKLFGEK